MESLGDILRRITASHKDRVRDGSVAELPEPEPECAICGGSGWVTRHVALGNPAFGQGILCACQPAIFVQTLENFQTIPDYPSLAGALQAVTDWTNRLGAPILVLNSERGRGKSHLLKAAANAIRATGQVCEYLRDGDLVDQIHASFDGHSTIQFMSNLEAASWVVIDDFGLSATQATMDGMLDRVIDNRSIAAEIGKRTLITTNLLPDQLTPRTAARLQDVRLVRPFTINAPDYRQNPISEE